MRAVIYLRVSTGKQEDSGLGLADQERVCRMWCEMQGYEIVKVLVDPAVSASKPLLSRPAGKELRELLTEGTVVVASKLDRVFRSMSDCVTTVEGWTKAGVKFACLDIGLDTSTPVGEMVMGIVAAVAQFERRRIGERISGALQEVTRRGGHVGPAPFGMKNTGSVYSLEVCEDEQDAVRQIDAMLEEGLSYSEAARVLNASGMVTRTGKAWTHTQVGRVAKRIRRVA